MKLRRQTPAKALVLLMTGALFFLFWSLVRADPQVAAQPAVTSVPPVDYERVFSPGAAQQPRAEPVPTQQPQTQPRPHTRTRAS